MSKRVLSLKLIYDILCQDQRITAWHMAICVALFFLCQDNEHGDRALTSRRELMELSRIRSIVTYHKCIKDLEAFGYIVYKPSYHPVLGSLFRLVVEPGRI